MSALRAPRTVAYTAERTEAGGWRLTLPLESVPSANRTTREHWRARKRRVDGLTGDLIFLRSYVARNPAQRPYFEHAKLMLTLYFANTHRRDPGNYGQGAGAKSLVDALVHAGWLADDDSTHLTCAEPVLCVDRENPRVEVELTPWNGVR